jgi:hypothetical protein
MNLAVHVLAKDLRRYWPLAGFAAVFIIVETISPLWGWNLELKNLPFENVLAAFAKWPVIFILVVAVMQEDLTVGDKAFWRTRPIGAGPLLAGKLLLFALVLALPALLANITIANALDTPGAVTLGIAVETIGFTLLAVLTAALLASLTGTLVHAGLAALGGLFVVIVIGVVREALFNTIRIRLPWDPDIAHPGARVAVACALACVALVALLMHQIFTRRTGRTVALLALAIPAVLATSLTWTVDLSPPTRAALFPDKPLTATENFTITVETPARVNGTEWVWDAPTRRSHPEKNVIAYADLDRAIPGRFFNLVAGSSILVLRDGRELNFSQTNQFEYTWTSAQRESAICRALGFDYAAVRDDPIPQGWIRLFTLPEKQLAALAGLHGRLTVKLVLGETVFGEAFRLPARAGAIHREPGLVWRIAEVARTEEGPVRIAVRFLRATTMLASRGDARADINPDPASGKLFYLVNQKRGDYAFSWPSSVGWKPGIVATSRMEIEFNSLHSGGRKSTNFPMDEAWLADAELVVLRTDAVGKTEKTVVVDDFEVPRADQ